MLHSISTGPDDRKFAESGNRKTGLLRSEILLNTQRSTLFPYVSPTRETENIPPKETETKLAGTPPQSVTPSRLPLGLLPSPGAVGTYETATQAGLLRQIMEDRSEDKVSSEWMEMDEAGVHRAAQATVLFVSPPPQLGRNYEPVSDWV